MTAQDIKFLDVRVQEDDVIKRRESIIYVLRPEWRSKDILEQKQGSGNINQMLVYHLASDADKKDAIIVRVFGEMAGLVNRDMELAAMQIAHHAGCFPKILAVFTNGVVYPYVRGENLTNEDLSNPEILRSIGRTLARFHSAKLDDIQLIRQDGGINKSQTGENILLKRFYARVECIKDEFIDAEFERRGLTDIPPVSYLKSEMRYFLSLFEELGFTQTSFAHADVHGNNIVYDAETGDLTLVDLELACGGPVTYDFAWLLGFYIPDFLEVAHLGGPVTDELLEVLVKSYLERRYELRGDDSQDISETEIRLLMLETKIMLQYIMLVYPAWGYLFLADPIKAIDGAQLCRVVWPYYDKSRTRVEQLREEFIKLKATLGPSNAD